MRIFLPVFFAMLAGCISDDNNTTPKDAGVEAAPEASIEASVDTGTDAPGTCAPGTADCDPNVPGCETSILTSDTNCGKCGYDCGGTGLCQQGVCQPEFIAKNVSPVSLAIGGTSVFWMLASEIDRCPVTGCVGSPSDVGDGVNAPHYLAPFMLNADANNIYFPAYTNDQSANSVFDCPVSGCTNLVPANFYTSPSDPAVELVSNTANLYWLDTNDQALTRIKKSDATTASINVTVTGQPYQLDEVVVDDAHLMISYRDIPVNGGGLYACDPTNDCANGYTRLLDTADKIADNGTIAIVSQPQFSNAVVACALAGCSGSGTPLANNEAGITAMIADANNVYWMIPGSTTSAIGTIRACSLPSCAGGPRTIAGGQAAPIAIAQDTNFIYWANAGVSGANSGSIMRIRK